MPMILYTARSLGHGTAGYQPSEGPEEVTKPEAYHGTTSGVTDHEILACGKFVHIRKVSTVHGSGFWFTAKGSGLGLHTDSCRNSPDDTQTLPPLVVSCSCGSHEAGRDGGIAHHLAPGGIPSSRYSEPYVRGI